MHLPGLHVSELKERLPLDHQKLLGLRVVVVPASGDAAPNSSVIPTGEDTPSADDTGRGGANFGTKASSVTL